MGMDRFRKRAHQAEFERNEARMERDLTRKTLVKVTAERDKLKEKIEASA